MQAEVARLETLLSEAGIESNESSTIEALRKENARLRKALAGSEAREGAIGRQRAETRRRRIALERSPDQKDTIRTLRKEVTRLNKIRRGGLKVSLRGGPPSRIGVIRRGCAIGSGHLFGVHQGLSGHDRRCRKQWRIRGSGRGLRLRPGSQRCPAQESTEGPRQGRHGHDRNRPAGPRLRRFPPHHQIQNLGPAPARHPPRSNTSPDTNSAAASSSPPWIAIKSRPGNSTKTPIAHAATWKTASRTANSICSPIA